MMSDKLRVFRPKTIQDTPFPMKGEADLSISQRIKGAIFGPKTIKDQPLPTKRVAHELLASALNTKSRRILKEFTFTEHGAIQIGKYKSGVSGDLRITPDGITARDKAGITTFAIDGETGDAVFKGTVQAGSIISESELIGGSININDRFTVDADGNVVITKGNITIKDEDEIAIIDSKGLISAASFATDNVVNSSSRTTTSQTWVDVPNTTLTFSLPRSAKVLIGVIVQAKIADMEGDDIRIMNVAVNVDASNLTPYMTIRDTRLDAAGVFSTDSRTFTLNHGAIETLAEGSHTIKLQFSIDDSNETATILYTSVYYIVLGK